VAQPGIQFDGYHCHFCPFHGTKSSSIQLLLQKSTGELSCENAKDNIKVEFKLENDFIEKVLIIL